MKKKVLHISALLLIVILFMAAAFPQTTTTAALELANVFQQLNTFWLGIAIGGNGNGLITISAPSGASSYTLQPPTTAGPLNASLCNSPSTPGQLVWNGCGLNGIAVSGTPGVGYTIVATSAVAATWQPSVTLSEGVTGSIGGSSLSAGTCSSGTATISAANVGDKTTATPTTYPGDGFYWKSYVSAAGTVTVLVCTDVAGGGTPTASVYNVGDWP